MLRDDQKSFKNFTKKADTKSRLFSFLFLFLVLIRFKYPEK